MPRSSALIGLAGLVVGAMGGWAARGARGPDGPTLPPSASTAIAASPASSGPLSADLAAKLVQKSMEGRRTECSWPRFERAAGSRWRYGEVNVDEGKCGAALEKAGLLKREECLSPGCGGSYDCCWRAASPIAPAATGPQGGLSFPCGKLEFLSVTSVTTDGNKATIKYEREFTPDPLVMTQVGDCKLDSPTPGRQTRDRKASRDDSGNWTIVD